MNGDLARNWWVVVLRGVLSILFGLIAFFMPGITLAALVIVFGAWAFIDGIFALVSAVAGQGSRPWWALVLRGLAGIAAGVIAFLLPGITAIALLFVIAAWAIIGGAFEISAAIRLRKQIEGEWLLGIAGGLSILFGALLLANPGAGALAVLWIIGAYAIAFGIVNIVLGFKLKNLRGHTPHLRPAHHPV